MHYRQIVGIPGAVIPTEQEAGLPVTLNHHVLRNFDNIAPTPSRRR